MAEVNELTKEGLMSQLSEMKTALEASLSETVKAEVAETLKDKIAATEEMKKIVDELKADSTTKEILEKLQSDMQTTIKAFDLLQVRVKGGYNMKEDKKGVPSLSEAITEQFSKSGVVEDLERQLKSKSGTAILKLGPVNLKAQGSDMTVANTLTGDGVISYNQRQAIIPAQKVNFRDLVPTVVSPTGLYVTYSEDAGETNNITKQTDGATKGQNEYNFTNVQTVNGYIAGFAVFTKQLLRNLPFMQSTLTRALMRDFFKEENSSFYTTVSGAATGPTTGGTNPDDVKQLIQIVGSQLDTNFNVSFITVSNQTLARIIADTYTSGYYPGAGSVILNDGRGVTIFGVPLVGASWVTPNYALAIDSDYIERVEVEGLNIAFSFEDADNFRQNKVTARIECMEAINLMRPESAIYMNLGAS